MHETRISVSKGSAAENSEKLVDEEKTLKKDRWATKDRKEVDQMLLQ
jgi:hypothetical protein